MKRIYILILALIFPLFLMAQEKLNNSFGFRNGLYKTFQEFKENKPSLNWNDITSDLIVMEPIHKAKIGNIKTVDEGKIIPIENIWGFCVNGIPYKKAEEKEGKELYSFSGLQLRGRICYYEYEMTLSETVEVSAYNPVTKKPFRTGNVVKEKDVRIKILMDFETGKTDLFTTENVKDWIKSDEKLLLTLNSTEENKLQGQLFKFIQIFNDRNPVMIK